MRLQVLLHSFGGLLLLVIALCFWFTYGLTPYEVFLKTTFVASITFLRLLSDDKYVLTFKIREDRIFITYLSQFLQVKSIDFALSDVTEARLSKQLIFYALWSPDLKLKVEGEKIRFLVIKKMLYNEIQQHLTSANMTFVK